MMMVKIVAIVTNVYISWDSESTMAKARLSASERALVYSCLLYTSDAADD